MNSEIEDRIQEARYDISVDEDIDIMDVSDKSIIYRLAEDLVFNDKELIEDLSFNERASKKSSKSKIKRDKTNFKYKFILRDNATKEGEPWTGLFENEEKADSWYAKFGSKAKLSPNKELVKVEVEFVAKKKYKYKDKRQ